MARGSYEINEGDTVEGGGVAAAPAVADVSYKSCLCALLIFLTFCLIITFVGLSFSKKGGSVKQEVKEEIAKKGDVGLIGSGRPTTTEAPMVSVTIDMRFLPPLPPTKKQPLATAPTTTPAPITTKPPHIVATTKLIPPIVNPPTTNKPTTVVHLNTSSTHEKTTLAQTTPTTPKPSAIPPVAIPVTPTPLQNITSTTVKSTVPPTKPPISPTTLLPIVSPRTTEKPTTARATTISPTIPPITPIKSTTPEATKPTPPATPRLPTVLPTTVNKTATPTTTTPLPIILPVTTLKPTTLITTPSISKPTVPPTTKTVPLTTALPTVLTTIPVVIKTTVPTTAAPTTPQITTTTQITTTVDDWTSDNYWNDTSTETDFSPLFKKSLPVCSTPACKSTGSRMLSLMDYSADPCEDFYAFSCGGAKNEVIETDTWRRISQELYLIDNGAPQYLQKFRTFYDSCVSHEHEFNYENRIAAVLTLVKEVGAVVFDQTDPESFDLTKLFAKLILRQSLRIMDVDIDTDSQSTKFIIKLSLPKKMSILKETGSWSPLSDDQRRCLGEQKKLLHADMINLSEVYNAYLECQKNRGLYLNSVETVVRALGFLTGDEFSKTQQIQDLRTTIEWGILDHLNELPPPNEQRKSLVYKMYELQKVSNLQTKYTFLQWKELLETLTGHTFEETTPIQVYFPNYFTNLFGELQKLPKWKINNALIAMFAQDLYENLVIPQAKHNREDYCVRIAAQVFPDLSSHLYMKTWPTQEVEEAQKFLTKIYNQLKTELTENIEKADWLDEGSKIPMMSKLKNKISLVFNKNDDIYNDASILNARYDSIMLNESNFMQNAVAMLQTSKKLLYDLQGKLYNIKYIWGNFVNAYDREPKSFYAKGTIVIPMGVIRIPVREEFPGYLTMAQLGLSLARELGRHFDLVGIQRGITLSPSFKRSFKFFRKTMEEEHLLSGTRMHNKHKVSFKGDPKLSANERIVDNTAVRLVTDSFHSLGEASVLPWVSTSYSREKIFFITLAQDYCKNLEMSEYMGHIFESEILPPGLRVENIVTNSEAFQKVFECPDGSAMNNNPNFKLQFPYLHKLEEGEGEDDDDDDSDDYLSNNQL